MAPEYSGGVMQGNSLLSLDQVPHIREKIEALRYENTSLGAF